LATSTNPVNASFKSYSESALEKYPHPEKISGLDLLKRCMTENGIDIDAIDVERYSPEDAEAKVLQSCIDAEGKYVQYSIDWKGKPKTYLRALHIP